MKSVDTLMQPIEPKHIGYITELDSQFSKELSSVGSSDDFAHFLERWHYWLDAETQRLKGNDWDRLKPLIADCRKDSKIMPEAKHDEAIALLMPTRIFNISIEAHRYKVPWGCAYIRLREMKKIGW